MGGGYTQPQLNAPQIPGAGALPQLAPPDPSQQSATNQAQNFVNPNNNTFNALLLSQLSGGLSNSTQNHAPGSGGIKPTYAAPQSPMVQGMFGS